MRRLVAHRLSSETGQTMAEYGVVLTVVAMAVLVSLSLLGGGISELVAAVGGGRPLVTSQTCEPLADGPGDAVLRR